MSAQDEPLGQNPYAPKGHRMSAQGEALGPKAGPFLPIFNPRSGVTAPPVIPLNGTGGVSSMCFAPLGLHFCFKRRSDPGLRPGL